MPTGAIISGIGSLASSFIGANAAKKASQAQQQAAQNSLNMMQSMWAGAKDSLNPWLTVGGNALDGMARLLGIGDSKGNVGAPDYSLFYNSPDYKFALEQGNRSVNNQLAASGLKMSGGALKAISEFNQGLATQNYGNYWNRLAGVSGQGLDAGKSLAGAAAGFAGGMGNAMQALGQAQASGIVGQANAFAGGINGATNNLMLYNYLNKNPSAYATGGGNANGWATGTAPQGFGFNLGGYGGSYN